MRIYISSILSVWAPGFGGGPTFVDEIARRFQALGHEVHVVYTRPVDQGDASPEYPVSWVRHSDHIILNACPVAREMWRLLRIEPADVCFATGVEGVLLSGLMGTRTRLVYGEFHPFLPLSLDLFWRRRPIQAIRRLHQLRFFYLTRRLARKAAHVISTSKFIQRQVITTYGIPPSRVTAIPTGVNTAVFKPRTAGTAANGVRIISVARLGHSKGTDILLQAFSRVVVKHPEARLTVVGGGDTELYRVQAQRLGIAGQVEITGHLPRQADVADAIRCSDVFVLPSRVEGFGNVLLEAMASHIAIVASKVGGIPEIVTHNRTGLLVPPEEPDQLGAALSQLIEDVGLRERLAEEGYRQVTGSGRYTWEASVDAHCDLFERLTASRV